MSSLADLPEIVGFFSYSREDDEAFKGTLSALRDAIQRELSAQLGRSKTNFRLWQDQEAIVPGRLWESEIKTAIEQAVFFIPIVTPRAVTSHYCKFEFEAFLAREHSLGRNDLVFPVLYMRVPALENEAQWRNDPVLSIIGSRQYVDWRPLRYLDIDTAAIREAIGHFCDKIVDALREPWVSAEIPLRTGLTTNWRGKAEARRAEALRLEEKEGQGSKEERDSEGVREGRDLIPDGSRPRRQPRVRTEPPLSPLSGQIARETGGQSGPGVSREGAYARIGITPSWGSTGFGKKAVFYVRRFVLWPNYVARIPPLLKPVVVTAWMLSFLSVLYSVYFLVTGTPQHSVTSPINLLPGGSTQLLR
jgi:hypothetical protein